MRPSCQSAKPWPCSAAYCRAETARAFSPSRSASAPAWNASSGEVGIAASAGADGVPSSDMLGPRPDARPAMAKPTRTILDVRITRRLCRAARMGHGTVERRADLLGVFPEAAGGIMVVLRLPIFLTLGKFRVRKLHFDGSGVGVDLDDVAIADECDRAADSGLRTDMANAEPPGRA